MPIPSGQTIVKFPPVGISASMTTFGSQNNCGGGLSVRIASPALQGYSTACAPALGGHDPAVWDASNPRYFSGTGCEAIASAVPMSGYLTHAQLCIGENGGDTVVKEYWDTGASSCPNPVPTDGSVMTGTNNTSGASLKALFDSTHFANSSIIVIKLRVWDSNGGYYDGAIQGPAKNRIYAYGDQTPTDIPIANGYAKMVLDDIFEHLGPDAAYMNYFQVITREDAKPAVLATIPYYTSMYVDSHGFVNSFGDCFATLASVDDHFLDFNDVQSAIAVKSQNFNLPPYNFVFLDCCNTAGDPTQNPPISSQLASAFLNGSQSTPNGLVDRAFMGWKNITLGIGQNARWTDNFYSNLSIGYTVSDAALFATLTFPELGPVSEQLPGAAFVRPIFPQIWGDSGTKMHGVYSGNGTGYDITWFKPL